MAKYKKEKKNEFPQLQHTDYGQVGVFKHMEWGKNGSVTSVIYWQPWPGYSKTV